MSLGHAKWKGRKKRTARRIANDFRLSLPFIGIAGCIALSATAIFAAERLPSPEEHGRSEVSALRAQGPKCDSSVDAERLRPMLASRSGDSVLSD